MNVTLRSSLTVFLLFAFVLTGCAGEISLTATGSSAHKGDDPDAELNIGIGGGKEDGNQSSVQNEESNKNTGRVTPTTPFYLVLAVIIFAVIGLSFILR